MFTTEDTAQLALCADPGFAFKSDAASLKPAALEEVRRLRRGATAEHAIAMGETGASTKVLRNVPAGIGQGRGLTSWCSRR